MNVRSNMLDCKLRLANVKNKPNFEKHILALIWEIKELKSADYFYTKVLPRLEREFITIPLVYGAYKFKNKENEKVVDFYPRRRRMFNCKTKGWVTVYRKGWILEAIILALKWHIGTTMSLPLSTYCLHHFAFI